MNEKTRTSLRFSLFLPGTPIIVIPTTQEADIRRIMV
jgi:hypothetical protein